MRFTGGASALPFFWLGVHEGMRQPSYRKSSLEENENLIGKRFGLLVVISVYRITEPACSYVCECKCDCGGEIRTKKSNITKGFTKSCGCLKRKNAIESRCCTCGVVKPPSEFWKRSININGLSGSCKSCARTYARQHELKTRYGVSVEKYSEMLVSQGGRCAICGAENPEPSNRKGYFSVDHCHETGEVRGLLCTRCNSGIGMLGDSPRNAMRAYLYLSKKLEAAG